MRAMVSPALPALTVLTASIERLGQSCARAAGAKMIRTAHATAPHHVRNDIDTSLECGRSSDRLRWPRWHDAPDRGAHATGGAYPALARRSPLYVGSGLKASLATGPKQRRMSGSVSLADVMMREGGGEVPLPDSRTSSARNRRDCDTVIPRLTPV